MELGRNVWVFMHAEAHLSVKGAAVVWLAFHLNVSFVLRNRQVSSKKSSIIRLVYKPFVLSPHLSLTSPLRLSLLYISSDKGVFCTILSRQSRLQFLSKPRPSISVALQVDLAVSLRLPLNPRYPEPVLLPLTMCERYFWPTQYIFINEFWFFKGPYEYIQVPLYFVIDLILNNDFYRPLP